MRWGINVGTSLCITGDRYVGPAWWGFLSQNMPSVIDPILRPILPSMSRNKEATHQNTLRRYIMPLFPTDHVLGQKGCLARDRVGGGIQWVTLSQDRGGYGIV